ncbi:MAG: 2-isopropylmalate synthase [Firmicutes bacterium]|nr:2-isopropylmalate synthase [Bacillota bacterium]MCL5065077.1 2-isopropylmalate synthase [Bacillota bacterium]
MDRIYILDTTLRDGEQVPGAKLAAGEKLEIARQLAVLGVDVIEAGFPASSPGDFQAVRTIAQEVRGVGITALARAVSKDIDAVWEAVREAEFPQIHIVLGVSDIHLEGKFRRSREEVLAMGVEAVRYAKKYTPYVEYSTEDAGRADLEYLKETVSRVIDAGATVVNIPDTTGYCDPEQFGHIIHTLKTEVANIDRAILSVHCHNDLGMATANTLAAIKNGARRIEVTVNGLGERAGNTALEEVVMAIKVKADLYQVMTTIHTEEITRTSRLVSNLTGIWVQPNKAIVGSNAFAHSSGIHQDGVLKSRQTYEIIDPQSVGIAESRMVLTARSGRHAVRARLQDLGRTIDDAQFELFHQQFLELADRKKEVYDEDLLALLTQENAVAASAYELLSLEASSGTTRSPGATVRLRLPDGREKSAEATGSGPVDAAYSAINRILGQTVRILEFSLQSVTEGIDAQARVSVRLAIGSDVFIGRATDSDVVISAVQAYLDAFNRTLHHSTQVHQSA